MWVSVGAAGHLRMVARTRALKLAVRLGRTAQGVCLLLRMRSAAGGIRSWLRNRMFLRVGGICLRGMSVVRAMATARPSQQVLIRGAMKGLPGTAMRYKSLKKRRTKPICVMTYSRHNMKKLLRFRRIPAVSSGLDGCQANPIFLETKPIPAGGAEGGGVGGSTKPEARPRTERERRDAWMEIARREWIRSRAEKEARERLAGLRTEGTNAGATPSTSGETMGSQDVRGP